MSNHSPFSNTSAFTLFDSIVSIEFFICKHQKQKSFFFQLFEQMLIRRNLRIMDGIMHAQRNSYQHSLAIQTTHFYCRIWTVELTMTMTTKIARGKTTEIRKIHTKWRLCLYYSGRTIKKPGCRISVRPKTIFDLREHWSMFASVRNNGNNKFKRTFLSHTKTVETLHINKRNNACAVHIKYQLIETKWTSLDHLQSVYCLGWMSIRF